MANPDRGEFEIQDGEKTWTIKFTNNSIREAEKTSGASFGVLVEERIAEWSITDMTILLWAGLRHHHPKINLNTAGDILDRVGYQDCLVIVLKAVRHIFGMSTDDSYDDSSIDEPEEVELVTHTRKKKARADI